MGDRSTLAVLDNGLGDLLRHMATFREKGIKIGKCLLGLGKLPF